MHTLTGAEIVIKLLEREGVTIIAGIPGGANLPLYDALYLSGKIRHVLARHEQGAGFIAQGIARSTGKTGVCLSTSGPGATNLLTAIADAYLDSVPIICITGQVSRNLLGKSSFQEIDICGMAKPAAKRTFLVRNAQELLAIIPDASRIASSGRPGPVLIDIPKDVQLEKVTFSVFPGPYRAAPVPFGDMDAVAKAALMLRESQKPLICCGGGVIHSGASGLVRSLAEMMDIPVTSTLMGLGSFPTAHPLSLGMLGMHGSIAANNAVHECDLFIALGKRFNDRTTGDVSAFCRNARIIHVDLDEKEIGKNKDVQLGIQGDIKEILTLFLPLLDRQERPDWRKAIAALRDRDIRVKPEGHPHRIIADIASVLPEDAIITTDVGQHQMWVAQAFPFSYPGQLLTSGGLGTMGFGLPAAIGASLAHPGKTVVNFAGDGSILMNLQELVTAVEENANVKIVVFNNSSLGLVHQQQNLFFGEHYIACDFKHTPDLCALARACGMKAFDITDIEQLRETIRTALQFDGPCLINVPIDKEAQVLPMVPPGKANTDMLIEDR
jgi:acetolactate synthase-1/2/3 large subunit